MKNLCFKLIPGLIALMLCCTQGYAQAPTATVTPTNTTCGLNNGSATVNPAGGNGSYTYAWSGTAQVTQTVTGLASGAQTVTVFSGGSQAMVPFTIGSSTAPTVTIAASRDTLCTGSADTLTATASSTGGTYTWSGGTLGTPTTANPLYISSLTKGAYSYSVTWTDAAGICTASNTYLDSIRYIDVIATSPTVTEPSCGRNNGQIIMGVSPSFRPEYTFYLNNAIIQNGSSPTASNLLPGTYKFIFSELSTGCTAEVDNIILTDMSTTPIFSSIVIKPETCFGNKDGAIYTTVSNCTGNCGYVWSQNASDNTDSATKLIAGSYTLSVISGGCSNIDTTIIVPGPTSALTSSLRVHTDHCSHRAGTAIAIAQGGTTPYSYVWSEGTAATTAGDSVNNIIGYTRDTVIVMDAHGCADTLSDSIGNTPGPSARITNHDTICQSESNGVLIVVATSNDGPFTYSWSSGSNTTVAGGLAPGTYSVQVINAVGCDTTLTDQVHAYTPVSSLTAIPNGLFLGQTTELLISTPVPVTGVHWTPYVDGSTNSTEVYAKPDTTTLYKVVIDYGQNCQLIDSALVTVLKDTTRFIVPNTFTPNGDGINDIFTLNEYPTLRSFHIWVYDRWGNKVFESTEGTFQWDGTDNFASGKPLNTGVFAYVIEYSVYDDPNKRIVGGNISLVK